MTQQRRQDQEGTTPDEEIEDVRELLGDVVRAMVDHPDSVELDVRELDPQISVEIHVHPDDVGFVLGRGGERARSLKEIFRAIYGRLGRRLDLYVVNPKRKNSQRG